MEVKMVNTTDGMSNITLDTKSSIHITLGFKHDIGGIYRYGNDKKVDFRMINPTVSFNSPISAAVAIEVDDYTFKPNTFTEYVNNDGDIEVVFATEFAYNAAVAALEKVAHVDMSDTHPRNRTFKFQRADGKSVMIAANYFDL
jgi:hypothetical protein